LDAEGIRVAAPNLHIHVAEKVAIWEEI